MLVETDLRAKDVKVSVLVITYNHEAFIRQALESVLAQTVTFSLEIIISEDCSLDRTRDIVIEYQQRYPEIVRLLLSERNLRSNEVVARGLRVARGTYIALLDGDDYWISSRKLQRQSDFLDQNPNSAICFHNAKVIYEDRLGNSHLWNSPEQKKETSIDDLWSGNFIATSSVMFRHNLSQQIPSWYIDMFPIGDWPLHILNAEHGSISFIDEVMSVYRQHSGGLYSTLSELQKQRATRRFYKMMNANLTHKYGYTIRKACSKYFLEWAEEYFDRGDMKLTRYCALVSMFTGGVKSGTSRLHLIKLCAKTWTRSARQRLVRLD